MLCGTKKKTKFEMKTFELQEVSFQLQEEGRQIRMTFLPDQDWNHIVIKTEEQIERERILLEQNKLQEEQRRAITLREQRLEKEYEEKIKAYQEPILAELKNQRDQLRNQLETLERDRLILLIRIETLKKMITQDQEEFMKNANFQF